MIDLLLIGLMGPAGAGKDTAADYLVDRHDFVRYAFANPMRDMLAALLVGAGIDEAYLFDPVLKETAIPELGLSYRQLAQTLGTEWGRSLDPDLWTKLAALNLGLPQAPIHSRIVITDVRFPNEAALIQKHGGRVLAIHRDVAPVRPHVSEQLMHHIEPWASIANTGSLNWLHLQLDTAIDLLRRSYAPA